MRKRLEKGALVVASPTRWRDVGGNCSCQEAVERAAVRECDCERAHQSWAMRRAVVEKGEEQISPAAALLDTVEDAMTTSTHAWTSSSPPTKPHNDQGIFPRSDLLSPTTTILTIATAPAPTSSSPASTRTFTLTGIQSIVPTYPPSTASSTPEAQTSLPTKLGLGLGIPLLVLLTILLTMLLHRQHRRRRRNNNNNLPQPTNNHHPEMAPTTRATIYPRLHRTSSSTTSTTNNIIIMPAPGVMPYFPPPLPAAPIVPRRSSARLRPRRGQVLSGPLDSHPSAIRAVSSIYEDFGVAGAEADETRRESHLGGHGVGDVLAEYLDFSPRHLYGPWDPGQQQPQQQQQQQQQQQPKSSISDMPQPPAPAAQRGQYLAVDVHHHHQHRQSLGGRGGVEDEVSPLSSSSSGEPSYNGFPARFSALSGLSPSSPVRTRSPRRI